MAMAYTNIMNNISKVNKPVHVQIPYTKYLQGNTLIKSKPWFTSKRVITNLRCEKHDNKIHSHEKYSLKTKLPTKSNHNPHVHTIIYKRLFDVFTKLIDPLMSPKDMYHELCTLLNKNIDLLKSITPHHKKLLNDIVNNSQSTTFPDLSYTNTKYMLFWSNIFNSKIYVVHNSTYKVYGESVSNSLVLRVIDDGFEYINASFITYQLKHNLIEYVDTSNLKSKSMEALRHICKLYKIDNPSTFKKAQLITAIEKIV